MRFRRGGDTGISSFCRRSQFFPSRLGGKEPSFLELIARHVCRHALELAADYARAYTVADPQTRRLWNQAFFKRIYIWNDTVSGAELTDAYAGLLASDLARDLERLKTPVASFGRGSIESRLVETVGIEPTSAESSGQLLRA